MSNFLLDRICDYLRTGIIQIKFEIQGCLESDLHMATIYKNGEPITMFKLTSGDKKVIEFVVVAEGLVDAIRC